jgi:hypothetical protein
MRKKRKKKKREMYYFDVRERGVNDFVIIRQAIDFFIVQVNENVMIGLQTMKVGLRMRPSALKVFSTNEASVDVLIEERYGAQFFEIEFEETAIDGI